MDEPKDDGYETRRAAAVTAARSGMAPLGAMLAAGIPLDLADRLRKGYASNSVYRDRVDELLQSAWAFVADMRRETNAIRCDAEYSGSGGRPYAQDLKRARDIQCDVETLMEQLGAEQQMLAGLVGMDESIISISLIKKRTSISGVEEESDSAGT